MGAHRSFLSRGNRHGRPSTRLERTWGHILPDAIARP